MALSHVPRGRLQGMPLSKITAASLDDTEYTVDPSMVSDKLSKVDVRLLENKRD